MLMDINIIVADNPSYFYNDDESSPRTPDSPTRRFFFFRRRSSSSNKLLMSPKNKERPLSPSNGELPPMFGREFNNNQQQSPKNNLKTLLRSKSQNSPSCVYSQVRKYFIFFFVYVVYYSLIRQKVYVI